MSPHDVARHRVTLGVSAGISIYKACDLARRLQDSGCEVRVVMTPHAAQMVAPVTFQALTGNPVIVDLFAGAGDPSIAHIELAKWEQLLLVAPATANVVAKFARGIADDFLSTHYLATTAPVLIAPAMNGAMWRHPATVENLEILKHRGHTLLQPEKGQLACGDWDEGRLPQSQTITQTALHILTARGKMAGLKVLVTAGPTREPLDAVRYISNRSSGKMGFAVAREAALRGAEVTLITGPVSLETPHGAARVDVTTAAEMESAVRSHFPSCDILVMAAAVADYRAAAPEAGKRKKDGKGWSPDLIPAPDILGGLRDLRRENQFLCGFAAETGDLKAQAQAKLQAKGLDLIAANDVSRSDLGFDSDRNALTLFGRSGTEERVPEATKERCASALWDAILEARSGR